MLAGCSRGAKAPSLAWPAVPPPPPNLAPTPLGLFSITTTRQIPARIHEQAKTLDHTPYMESGGTYRRAMQAPAPGMQFLILVFPSSVTGFRYSPTDMTLQMNGEAAPSAPVYMTIGFGAKLATYPFTTYEDSFFGTPGIPIDVPPKRQLAVAFEVPLQSSAGTITVKSVVNAVTWTSVAP